MTQQPKKLLDQVRDAICTKHTSYRTEQSFMEWKLILSKVDEYTVDSEL